MRQSKVGTAHEQPKAVATYRIVSAAYVSKVLLKHGSTFL